MNKRKNIKCICLAIALTLSINILSPSFCFAETDEQAVAGNKLYTLGLYQGYEDGTLKLDNLITRAEMTVLLVRTLGYDDKIIIGVDKKFNDVSDDYWASEDISKAVALGLVSGYPDQSFKPTKNINYTEVVALMVKMLKKDKELTGEWPNNYLDRAASIGIIQKDENLDPNHLVTRGEVAQILWSTLLLRQ